MGNTSLLEQNEHIHSQSDQDFNPEVLERAVLSEDEKDALQTRNLLNEIQEALEAYKGSINSLSHKSGVDPKTIRKMRNGEYKRAPNAETVQRVLSVVSKQRSLLNLANYYGGNINLFLRKAFPVFFNEDANFDSQADLTNELISKIKDEYTYQVVKIVKGKKGVPKYELIDTLTHFIYRNETKLFETEIEEEELSCFRPLASLKLKNMINSGLLVENRETGRIELFNKSIEWHLPFSICRQFEGTNLNFYQEEHNDLLDYFWRVTFGNCSYKELNEISHIMWDAHKKCTEILYNSKSEDVRINFGSSLTPLKYYTRGEAREEAIGRKKQKGELK